MRVIVALSVGLISGFVALVGALYAGLGILMATLLYAVCGGLGLVAGALVIGYRDTLFSRERETYAAEDVKAND